MPGTKYKLLSSSLSSYMEIKEACVVVNLELRVMVVMVMMIVMITAYIY